MSDLKLSAGDVTVEIAPDDGARVSSLVIGGTELLRQGPRYGCFPMVPWCGRIAQGRFRNGETQHQMPLNSGPHAIHGTGRDTVWRVRHADDTTATLTYELAEPWPYPGLVTQTFRLTDSALELTLGVETRADSFPAQVGWHPWFNRSLGAGGEDVSLAFAPAFQLERGEDHLPTGRRIDPRPGPWDDCFGMPDGVEATLTWPGQLALTVSSPARWVVVYDEQAEAVCVEAQSGPPDGLNTDPELVTRLQPLELAATWSWERL
ncbi:aldose epimerase family protein [Streptomyces sp. NBC_01497]|uniref:aldose epimerase family protein n=1 Tax=Streptomyces sp. NBC_01497 TaxID=2903885 RepID=UPI002E329BDB|nr:aldose 1-epimerase [Streptomyces sp. NBC_01497]